MGHTKRLLLINPKQFGYHLDMYYYCRWAATEFRMTYHGFDGGQPKLDSHGTDVHYVARHGNLLVRYLRFLRSCLTECGGNYDLIFVKYFAGCSLLRLRHPRKRFVLDIRTGSVAMHPLRRWCEDLMLRVESRAFRHVTAISASLARKLGLANAHILPLGANPVETLPKDFRGWHLLYVGTFQARRIEDTVAAFHRFHREAGQGVEMTYDIVGDGPNGERDRLRAWVKDHGLEDVVSLPGFLHHQQLRRYYERCNVGVSYIPISRTYDCQPPTKTFEYLLAGLPVIATKTSENAAVITEQNGLLIEDTPEAFYQALQKLTSKRNTYSSERIRAEALCHSWETIVRSNLVPYLKALIGPGGDAI